MLAWLQRHQFLALPLAIVVIIGSLVATRVWWDGSPEPIEFQYGSAVPEGSPIRVHVAGAVVSPGVYELREGDRIVDALAAAGGPTAEADTETLNLARRLRDEEQVLLVRKGPSGAAEKLPSGAKININTASASLLDTLPGIGEAYSRRIVDSRAVDGTYGSAEDLVGRIIPRATYELIRDLITVE